MKFIHISDLHLPTKLPFLKLRGKPFIGYLNYYLRRRKLHPIEVIESIVSFIKNSEYDCLIISGDITNISHEKEFIEAKRILSPVLNEKAFLIPGNHDRYSLESLSYFEKYFGEFAGDQIPSIPLYAKTKKFKNITLLGLDSNHPTSIANASGFIEPETLYKSFNYLKEKQISKFAVVCHHPIWNPPDKFESIYHRMTNREEVQSLFLEHPPIAYFHGHAHTNWIKNKSKDMPYSIVNSASSTRLSDARHESGFHTGDLSVDTLNLKRFAFSKEKRILEEKNLASS